METSTGAKWKFVVAAVSDGSVLLWFLVAAILAATMGVCPAHICI
jgi:hypothetical protein